MEDFYVFLTFDIDQDFNIGSNDYYNKSKPVFKGLEKGVPLIIEKLRGLPFSVFLRADYQIQQLYGSYTYLCEAHSDIIANIRSSNGEINWHIHTYERTGDEWVQILDNSNLLERFKADYENVRKITTINSNIVRIGECVMSNQLMELMNQFGIKIDSSALPGRKRYDESKTFDWSRTTNLCYFPSITDYQVSDDLHYDLLEVPMGTILMKAPYDNQPFKRYFNLAFHTDILFQNFDEYVQNSRHLVAITHPYEILSEGFHQLLSYSIDTFENNLKELIKRIEKAGKRPVFKKIGDLIYEKNVAEIFTK